MTNEFPKAESFEFNKEKIIEKNIFKEPYIEEKEKRRIFPEPEVLAPYYDPELELGIYLLVVYILFNSLIYFCF